MHLPLSPQEYLHTPSAASDMADLRCANDDLGAVPATSEVVFRHFRDALSRFPTGVTVITAVSYTHLDVYKRQAHCRPKAVRHEQTSVFRGRRKLSRSRAE